MPNVLMTLTTPDNTGASRVAFEYARAIVDSGSSCTVVHGVEPAGAGVERASLVEEMRDHGIGTQELLALKHPAAIAWLVPIGRRLQSDLVIGNNQRDRASAVFTAKKLGIPSVICGHNEHRFRGVQVAALTKRLLYERAMRAADLIICSGERVLDEYVHDFGVSADRCVLMPHGIDLARFDAVSSEVALALRQRLGFGESDFIIVNVGRLDPQKGQDILLDAVRQANVAGLQCLVVGEEAVGNSSSERFGVDVRRLAEQMENVHLLGWRDDFDLLTKAADAYVHAARYEGLPLVVLSSLALETPTLVPENSSMPPGFASGVHGVSVEADSSEQLARGIELLAEKSRAERAQLGAAGRSLVAERYDMAAIRQRFVELIEDVVRNR